MVEEFSDKMMIDTYDGVFMLLASGGKWKVTELAKETGKPCGSIRTSILVLTHEEPRLVEDDKGRVFFYEHSIQ